MCCEIDCIILPDILLCNYCEYYDKRGCRLEKHRKHKHETQQLQHLETDKHSPGLHRLLLGEEPLFHHGAQHLQVQHGDLISSGDDLDDT